MSRLRKRDVAQLLDRYDADPTGALGVALARVLDLSDPLPAWSALVAACGFDAERSEQLLRRDPEALDALAAELNELRELPI